MLWLRDTSPLYLLTIPLPRVLIQQYQDCPDQYISSRQYRGRGPGHEKYGIVGVMAGQSPVLS